MSDPTTLTTQFTMPLEVERDDIAMMIDTNIYRDTSPWVGRITRYTDSGTGEPYWKVWYDGAQDDEGTFTSKVRVTERELLDAFVKAAQEQWQGKHGGLCCVDEMIRDKSLAIGCAQDSDVILQYAILGEAIYG